MPLLGRNPTSSRSPTPRRRFKEFKFKYGIPSGSSRSSNGIKSCSKTINSCKSAFFLTYSLFGRLCSKPRPSLRNKNHHMAKVPSRGQKSGSIKNGFWKKSLCDMFPSSCATPEHIFHPKYHKNSKPSNSIIFIFSMKWFE